MPTSATRVGWNLDDDDDDDGDDNDEDDDDDDGVASPSINDKY